MRRFPRPIFLNLLATAIGVVGCGGGGSGGGGGPRPNPPPPPSNSSPVANTVTLSVDYGTTANGDLNAQDADGDSLVYEIVDQPTNGDLVADSATGSFEYTPTIFEPATDQFTYRVSDGQAQSSVASVDITITRSAAISANYALAETIVEYGLQLERDNPGQPLAAPFYGVITIDLDNDDDDDLLVAYAFNICCSTLGDYFFEKAVIYRNTPSGFVQEVTDLEFWFRDAAVADYNGDGLDDVFIGNTGYDSDPFPGQRDFLLLQDQNGALVDVSTSNLPDESLFTHSACAVDVDADGDLDIYVGGQGEPRVYENNGLGEFVDTTDQVFPEEVSEEASVQGGDELSFTWCETADFDNDGYTDLALGPNRHDGPSGSKS